MSLWLYIPKHSFFHSKSKDLFENFSPESNKIKVCGIICIWKTTTYEQHCAQAVYSTLTRLGSRKLRPTLYFWNESCEYIHAITKHDKADIYILVWLFLEKANFFISTVWNKKVKWTHRNSKIKPHNEAILPGSLWAQCTVITKSRFGSPAASANGRTASDWKIVLF